MNSKNKSLAALMLEPLKEQGSLSREFIQLGCHRWKEALEYVNRLRYARNADSNNFHLVLEEKRGTCSTKHALLAALAEEQGVPLFLMTGPMEMKAQHFSPLGPVLKKYHLTAILETHCYLMYEGKRIDATFPGKIEHPQSSDFLKEWQVTPCDIGDVKIKRHQEEMKHWIVEKNIPYSFEEVWKIREEC